MSKSGLCVLASLFVFSSSAHADTLDEVQDTVEKLELSLGLVGDELSSQQLKEINGFLENALDVVKDAGDTATSDIRCFASQSQAGKYYLGLLSNPTQKIGNYFSSQATCKQALSALDDNSVCYESASQAGKAFLANLDAPDDKIGNYYSGLDNCVEAFEKRTNEHVCMESVSKPGKWFLAGVKDGQTIGAPFFDSLTDCTEGTAGDFACFPSQSQAGKYYLASLDNASSKIGNYFSGEITCNDSLALMSDNMMCFESSSQAG